MDSVLDALYQFEVMMSYKSWMCSNAVDCARAKATYYTLDLAPFLDDPEDSLERNGLELAEVQQLEEFCTL